MAKCVVFIEGSRRTDNGDLRGGFGRLLQQANLPAMPQLVMCDDTDGAIRKFRLETEKPASAFERVLLLVDLDGASDTRTEWLANKGLTAQSDHIFFMVQKMEAWFLAQPAVVEAFYQPKLTHALPGTAAHLVRHPDQVLERCTTSTRKGRYHKTGHGARLLALLHLGQLQAAFPDVAALVQKL